jgi:hypothetical protein
VGTSIVNTTEELFGNTPQVYSTEELFGDEKKKVFSTEELFPAKPSMADMAIQSRMSGLSGAGNIAAQMAKRIPAQLWEGGPGQVVSGIKMAIHPPPDTGENPGVMFGRGAVGGLKSIPMSVIDPIKRFIKDPHGELTKDPMGILGAFGILAGLGSATLAKFRAGQPVRGIEIQKLVEKIPDEIATPKVRAEVRAKIPPEMLVEQPTTNPLAEATREILKTKKEPDYKWVSKEEITPEMMAEQREIRQQARDAVIEENYRPPLGTKPEVPGAKALRARRSIEGLPEPIGGGVPPEMMGGKFDVGGIRIDKFKQPNDVILAAQQIAEKLPKKTVKSIAQTKLDAEELGMSDKQFIRASKKFKNMDAVMEAGKELTYGGAENFRSAWDQYRQNPTPENMNKAIDALNQGGLIMHSMRDMGTSAGRSINMMKYPYEPPSWEPFPDLQKMAAAKMLKRVSEGLDPKQVLEDFAKIDQNDPRAVAKFIRDRTDVRFRDKAFEVRICSALSGGKTLTRNALSTGLNINLKPLDTLAASFWEMRKYFRGEKPEIVPAEAWWQIKGPLMTKHIMGDAGEIAVRFAGIKEALANAIRSFKTETSMYDVSWAEQAQVPAIGGELGYRMRTPLNFLRGTDDFYKTIVFNSEAYGRAFRKARSEMLAGKIPKERLTERTVEIVSDLAAHPDILQACKDECLYRTWNNPMGNLGKLINNFRKQSEARWLVLFQRTTTNIIKGIYSHSPAYFPKVIYKALSKEWAPTTVSMELGKATVGTGILGVLFYAASKGLITGSGPTNPIERKRLLDQGWKPSSVKVGDKYISLRSFDPASEYVTAAADLLRVINLIPEKDASKIMQYLAYSFTNNVVDQTWLQSLQDLSEVMADPTRTIEYFAKKQISSTVVPSIVSGAAAAKDPYIRDVRTMLDAIQNKIPIWRESLPAKRDIYGKPISSGAGGFLAKFLLPVNISKANINVVDKELARLGINVSTPSKIIGGKKLSIGEYEKLATSAGGKVYARLMQIINSPNYNNIPDEAKKSWLRSAITQMRGAARQEWEKQ